LLLTGGLARQDRRTGKISMNLDGYGFLQCRCRIEELYSTTMGVPAAEQNSAIFVILSNPMCPSPQKAWRSRREPQGVAESLKWTRCRSTGGTAFR
jgi:hypothetical protein